MTESKIRVLLVDDHKVLRDGLRVLVDGENDLEVISEAGTGEEAIQKIIETTPDVVVLDIGLPDTSGIDIVRKIRQQELPVRIVILSMYDDRELVIRAIEAGCDGYVPKSSAHTDLLQAIRTVHTGKRFLHPEAATEVIDGLLEKQDEARLLTGLSKREVEVLRLTARGFTSRDIGEKLALSPKTVDTYRQRAMIKLDLESRADLISFALRAGLLNNGNIPE
ncbi:MAG: response regulator transcription factor [Anaerolineae bacterium]|jgi:two-component system, NarL family, response regulator NreC|nr:response regulator transcription factor [Anaerolineae bacterium]MBT7072494.1 response regulator transcription factor [Anaerolineae bacterium]MBT7325727.1 response regulator transcription factor [Anaerolineae bacterium]